MAFLKGLFSSLFRDVPIPKNGNPGGDWGPLLGGYKVGPGSSYKWRDMGPPISRVNFHPRQTQLFSTAIYR